MKYIMYILYLLFMIPTVYKTHTCKETINICIKYFKRGPQLWKEFDEKYYINRLIKDVEKYE